MEKPLLILKPSLTSAIVPIFAKSFLKLLPVGIILLIVAYALQFLSIIEASFQSLTMVVSLIFLIVVVFPMKFKLMMLGFTKYYFYKTHVISIFKFIKIKRNSLPYTQITNIKIHISFWDRICRTGKISLSTAERGVPGMILTYIKKPYEIEKMLHSSIHKYYESGVGNLSNEV